MEDRVKNAVFVYNRKISVKPKQVETLCHVLNGNNVLVNLPVGYGKSLIFHVLPELLKSDTKTTPIVIVISPLNIIHKDQLSSLAEHSIPSYRLNIETKLCDFTEDGKVYEANSDVNLDDVIAGKFRHVFCHPEALLNTSLGRKLLDNDDFCSLVVAVVVDGCHILDKW
ncbi:uncharacterized protein LOC134255710 [Saccostrea cucullata]|uniref:uncharacterized protein LOC134255710 n=1 Tax=Saccostrea cuccullata TaxID=36930 RepID=UPI002ED597E3